MSRVERAEASQAAQERQAASVRKRKKKKKGGCLWILVLILAILVAGGGYYTMGLRPVDPNSDEQIVVDIPNGSGASTIVEILDEAGLVKNKFCAKVNSRIGHYNSLQANTYIFSPSMSFQEIMTAINTGDFDYLSKESIEVKDGARLQQVAEAVSEKLPYSADEILEKWADTDYLNELIDRYWFLTDEILNKDVMYPLEGYLYADTYIVTDNMTLESFTEMCLDRMDEELSERRGEIGFIGERISSPSIECTQVAVDKSVLIAPADYDIPSAIKLTDAIQYPFIWRETGSATRRSFEQAALKLGFEKDEFEVAALVDDMDTMIRSVEAGLGVAIISDKLASSLGGKVKVADIKDFNEDRVFYMISLKSTSFSPAAEAFSEYVKENINIK